MTRRRAALAGLALGAALAGCDASQVGTLTIGLTTAPGSTVMDRVTRLRLTFTSPLEVLTIDRTEGGFDLALELPATGELGSLTIEGIDAGGALAATGATPPYPVAASNADIVVYMAPPMSIGPAPVTLTPARTRPSAGALGYGAILAGGVDAAGAPSDVNQIYNAYNHTLQTGLPLPEPRTGAALGVTSRNVVFLFGGAAPDGGATETLWNFDAVSGTVSKYDVIKIEAPPQGLARAGAAAIPVGSATFLLTGAPPIQLGGTPVAQALGIPAVSSGASVLASDRTVVTVAIDAATGDLLQIRSGKATTLSAQRKGATAVALLDGRVAVIGGEAAPRDAVIVDPTSGELRAVPGALAETYEAIAVAATARFVVVAGRRAGAADTAVEILDAVTLAHRHSATVADAITDAIALPNGQVLLIGATLQLFTPSPQLPPLEG